MGGKDAASARYLHTQLNKVTRYLFPEADDHNLDYVEEDGKLVEPQWYIPIIPMALVNGCEGIGTGWSTNIPNYCPKELASNILKKLNGGQFNRLVPHYKGFTGEMVASEKGYTCKGHFEYDYDDQKLDITELPIHKWTRDTKNEIEKIMQDKDDSSLQIDDMLEYHTTRKVHF